MKFKEIDMSNCKKIEVLIHPFNADKQIGATLEYTSNEIILRYIRKAESFLEFDEKDKIDEVYVLTGEGEYIILKEGFSKKIHLHTEGVASYEYKFNYMLVERNKVEEFRDNMLFNKFEINCTYFKDILTKTPFKVDSIDETNEFNSQITGNLKIVKKAEIDSPKLSIYEKIASNLSQNKNGYDITFSSIPYLKFIFEDGKTFKNLIPEIVRIRNAFSFLMDLKIKVSNLYFYSEQGQCYKIFWSMEKSVNVSLKSQQKLIDCKKLLTGKFQTIFSNFYTNNNLEDIFESYVNNMYRPIYVEDYLLSQISMIEGLDTRFRDINRNVSLKIRLEKFLNQFSEAEKKGFIELINGKYIQEDLIKSLNDFRNYHFHLYETSRKPYIKLDLYELAQVFRELIRKSLLSIITADEEV